MAAPMIRGGLGVFSQLCKIPESILGLTSVRCASKKAGGSSRNKRKRTTNKHRGIKTDEGTLVHRGAILVRQLGLVYYPGENVGCGKDCTLYALEDGKVMITAEALAPYPNSPIYPYINNGGSIHKRFLHVLPEEQQGTFKLVSQV